MSLFETASKNKLRFSSIKGNLTTEDLWDLPLTSKSGRICLDNIAKQLYKELKDSTEESFVLPKTIINKELETKLEIVKHVIKIRMEENDAKAEERQTKLKNQQILELIVDKKNDELKGKSIAELEAMIK